MVRRCCVHDCKESDVTILAHRFPKMPEVAVRWRNALDLQNVTTDDLQKKFVVCTKHFAAAAYRNEISNSLNTTAIPNLDDNATNVRISIQGSDFKKNKDTVQNVHVKYPHKRRKLEESPEEAQDSSDVTYVEQLFPVDDEPEMFEACEYTVEETAIDAIDDEEEEDEIQHDEVQKEPETEFSFCPTNDQILLSHQETQTDDQLPEEAPAKEASIVQPQVSKDDKIIKILYPEYEGMNRLELIELVSEKNRKIEALEEKMKKLEEAMRTFL